MQLYIALLLVSGLCCGCLGETVFLGGGATGDSGSSFVGGTAYVSDAFDFYSCNLPRD